MRKLLVFSIAVVVVYFILLFAGQFKHDTSLGYAAIIAFLVVAMGIILLGCELFANGVECVGDRMNLSHATSGSILAAVGTALPETLLPVLALVFGTGAHKQSIAIGAIIGAPFMLSTLAFCLVGLTSFKLWVFGKRERPEMQANLASLKFELSFFIPVMLAVLAVSLVQSRALNIVAALILLLTYAIFVKVSLGHAAEEGEEYTEHFHFSYIMSCPSNMTWIVVQTVIGLILIIIGAHIFVDYLTLLSQKSGISSLILSLLIAPVATELPEKFNSISWTIKRQDTLAISNVSGAMVFQSTIPVSIGLLFTDWRLGRIETLNIILSLSMAAIILLTIAKLKRLPSWALMLGGLFYLAYVVKVFVV